MQRTISKDRLLVSFEWALFIVLCIISCWFASGVMEQFLSSKTSFCPHDAEGNFNRHPAIVIRFYLKASEVNISNVNIIYKSSGSFGLNNSEHILKIGKNYIPNGRFNQTEVVLLESLVASYQQRSAFRIIHLTPIIKDANGIGGAEITVEHRLMKKSKSWKNNNIHLYFTSPKNSPGFINNLWKDGKPLQLVLSKKTETRISIEPEKYMFLRKNGKCQQESFYECIISKFDIGEFKECSKKCIPSVYSNIHKNYITPFCRNDTENEKCAMKMVKELINGKNSSCKKSCFKLQYIGEVRYTRPFYGKKESSVNYYRLRYLFDTDMFNVHEEYLLYDTIGMIGSVGGSLGMFIGFSMTGTISWIFVYLKSMKFSNFNKI